LVASLPNYGAGAGGNMEENIQKKMQTLMYGLTKHAAMNSYHDFLEYWGISEDDYEEIKKIWEEKLGIKPYV
jgi:hypothetical protein